MYVSTIRELQVRVDEFLCTGFEQANQPIRSDVQRRNLLHFCIVGEPCHLDSQDGLYSDLYRVRFVQAAARRASSLQLNCMTSYTPR